ncbi:hypothetical protein MX054_002855 [Enterobacter cloacae]|nr:hypothetical protein [Enterobacter cloacae]
MKKRFITTLTLAAILISPAHAISEKYRAQLERSGCTQVKDGNGCDIHKTKAAAEFNLLQEGFGSWLTSTQSGAIKRH